MFHEMTGFYAGSEAQVRKSLYLVPAAADLISVLTGLTGDWGGFFRVLCEEVSFALLSVEWGR